VNSRTKQGLSKATILSTRLIPLTQVGLYVVG
jgi:hypothetical protein